MRTSKGRVLGVAFFRSFQGGDRGVWARVPACPPRASHWRVCICRLTPPQSLPLASSIRPSAPRSNPPNARATLFLGWARQQGRGCGGASAGGSGAVKGVLGGVESAFVRRNAWACVGGRAPAACRRKSLGLHSPAGPDEEPAKSS
jgi:hypothetical protein